VKRALLLGRADLWTQGFQLVHRPLHALSDVQLGEQ
jgi:hypothetical protein